MPDWENTEIDVTESTVDTDVANSVSGSYSPRYVGLGDIPIGGPGTDGTESKNDFSDVEKRKSLFFAESKIELDLNDGHEIDEDDVSRHHQNAVMNLATHLLTAAAEDPDSTSVGDMVDSGGGAIEAATPYFKNYKSIISGIRESEEEAGGIDNHFRFVNGRSSPARDRQKRRDAGSFKEYYG